MRQAKRSWPHGLGRFAHVDRFSWAQQALNAKIPAPVEDARILKVARRGLSTIEQ